MDITITSENIRVFGFEGTWYVIDCKYYDGNAYYLLEHEMYGDETASIIVDRHGKLVLDDVWNGFDDLEEFLEE